jgi:hypothetical protein
MCERFQSSRKNGHSCGFSQGYRFGDGRLCRFYVRAKLDFSHRRCDKECGPAQTEAHAIRPSESDFKVLTIICSQILFSQIRRNLVPPSGIGLTKQIVGL